MTPLNPFFRRSDVILREVVELVESGQKVTMTMPFSFQLASGDWWLLPYEPLVSVEGENVIITRNVAKQAGRGTIKERWSEGDIKITIEGTFVNADINKYPDTEIQKLRQVISQRRAVGVQNELLQLLNVNQIVIKDYSLPFSKGANVQNYSLSCLSDDSYNLFIEVK
ncbi:hypothetical protein D0T49_00365 [Paludibacter sp. 221]|uniref:DUF6046 domain-containing protein n=1 Tax=Paludibacter sp. 221 TaxID=2302939 RepID=UPI0013D716C2|nr:DUF6046 domain-containing protein [Paludibacter sp. 221]NDV45506.1 hypothetical protein [Paludibacter sp. 221]